MINKLTYKHKYWLSLLAIILMCVLVYLLAIKKTITVISQYDNLSEKKTLAVDAPRKIAAIEVQLKQMEQVIVNDKLLDIEQLLLEKITDFCQKNKITLIEFPKTHISTYQDYRISTNLVVLEGDFKNILRLIYEAEQKYPTGKVVSVQFKKTRDIRTRQNYLYAYIFFKTSN